MEKFTLTNLNSESIVIGGLRDAFLLSSHSGTSSAEILVTSRKGYNQNGQFYVKTNLGTRIITLEFYTRRTSDYAFYQTKRQLSHFFNPLIGEMNVTYKNDYIEKEIYATVTGMPELTSKNQILGKYTVELTAHNPFWQDTSDTLVICTTLTGGLSFPLKFSGDGVIFAEKGARATLNLVSDVNVPVTAEFSGACDHPILRNRTTGEYIEIDTAIGANEKIIVTTDYGNKNVIKVAANGTRTNVNNLITDSSDFFSLIPGSNFITFDAVTGEPRITLKYRNLYTGV